MPRPYGPLMDIQDYRSVSSLRYFTAQTRQNPQTLHQELFKVLDYILDRSRRSIGKNTLSNGKRMMEERIKPTALAGSLSSSALFSGAVKKQVACGVLCCVASHLEARNPRPSFLISPRGTPLESDLFFHSGPCIAQRNCPPFSNGLYRRFCCHTICVMDSTNKRPTWRDKWEIVTPPAAVACPLPPTRREKGTQMSENQEAIQSLEMDSLLPYKISPYKASQPMILSPCHRGNFICLTERRFSLSAPADSSPMLHNKLGIHNVKRNPQRLIVRNNTLHSSQFLAGQLNYASIHKLGPFNISKLGIYSHIT